MSEIRAKLVLTNAYDEMSAEKGLIKPGEVRRVEVEGLVDTGAVMLLIPQDLKEALGLETTGKVIAVYADERKEELEKAGPVKVEIKGRSVVTECLVGPPTCEVLIGHVILEMLDLTPDPVRGELLPRPESPFLPQLKMKRLQETSSPPLPYLH